MTPVTPFRVKKTTKANYDGRTRCKTCNTTNNIRFTEQGPICDTCRPLFNKEKDEIMDNKYMPYGDVTAPDEGGIDYHKKLVNEAIAQVRANIQRDIQNTPRRGAQIFVDDVFEGEGF